MQNLENSKPAFRLSDSGASGVWRAVAEVPEYVAAEAAPEDDYVQRMNVELWTRLGGKPRATIPFTAPARVTRQQADVQASRAGWDLAVAFGVHAAGMAPGPARERIVKRCLDALEAAIEAGHPRPPQDHRDFAAVAGHPRFDQLAAQLERQSA